MAPAPFELRRRRIERARIDETLRADALAMCAFDEATDVERLRAVGRADDAAAIEQLIGHLASRAIERAAWALHGLDFEPPARRDEALADTIATVERLLRDALIHMCPGSSPRAPVRVPLFERVLAEFIAGELDVTRLDPLPADTFDTMFEHGVPNSANFFCFPEAMFLFARRGADRDFWLPLLPGLVCDARFFASHYWNGTERRWSAYGPRVRHGLTSRVVLAHLEQHYLALQPAQLAVDFGLTLASALRKEPSLPTPQPLTKEFA